MEYAEQRRTTVLCAALTSNVAMMHLQDRLHKQAEPLTSKQQEAIHDHLQCGIEILKRAGISDELLLQIVLQHHERINGSGYRDTPNRIFRLKPVLSR
jgi:HD-GYP domain-containing protein (c-di-GMP phosphodiesterase class II)